MFGTSIVIVVLLSMSAFKLSEINETLMSSVLDVNTASSVGLLGAAEYGSTLHQEILLGVDGIDEAPATS